MKHVIVLNGTARSGKDTLALFIHEAFESLTIYNLSTVDKIKEVATILGWTGEKDDKSRKFLSDLKDLSTEYNNGPFRYIVNSIENNDSLNTIHFIHCREPKEIQKLKDYFGHMCHTVLMRRPDVQRFNNHADQDVEQFNYDHVILNDGTLNDLRLKAVDLINRIIG